MGDTLYFHGSPAGGVIGAAASGAPLCISAVVLDGVVVAHSACHSGLNYRSVLLTGTGREVEDPAEVELALRAITERVTPGGWERGRLPRAAEIAATAVAAVAVTGFTVRARSGPAEEDEADRALPAWSGVSPWPSGPGPPCPTPGCRRGRRRRRCSPGPSAPDGAGPVQPRAAAKTSA